MEGKPYLLYGIGGLGADHRVFSQLSLEVELIAIKWIRPNENEAISTYAMRILNQIDVNQNFGILAISFGGIVAIELCKFVNPSFIILISSVSKSSELPKIKSIVSNLNLFNFIPNFILIPPFFILSYLFSAKNKTLLREIIRDTDPIFLRWALNRVIDWNSEKDISNVHLIHGSSDRLIPLTNTSSIVVEKGGHFMIVDRASEISEQIDRIISEYL